MSSFTKSSFQRSQRRGAAASSAETLCKLEITRTRRQFKNSDKRMANMVKAKAGVQDGNVGKDDL